MLELTCTSTELQGFAQRFGYDGKPHLWKEARRLELRCEIDAALFHLYGMVRQEVEYIMDTFPIIRQKDQSNYGEYRTKRIIMEIFDKMTTAREE